MWVGSVPRAKFRELGFDRPHVARLSVVKLLVEVASGFKVLFRHLRRALFDRESPPVVGMRRIECHVSVATSQCLGVAQSPHKVKSLSAEFEPSGAEAAALVKSTRRSAMMPLSCFAAVDLTSTAVLFVWANKF